MPFKIKIPLTSLQPDKAFITDMKASTTAMVDNYGNFFRGAANATNIPVQALYSIAMTETRGKHNPDGNYGVSGSEKSTGILQVSPEMAYEYFAKEVYQNRLTPQMEAIWRKYVPSIHFTLGQRMPGYPAASQASWNAVFKALKNPEFNIYASAMIFRRLLEDTADKDGTMRLDKAIVKYNIGHVPVSASAAYNFGDTTSLANALNPITKKYILQNVGQNGGMHYYIVNNIS
jgi:hypothetical protein